MKIPDREDAELNEVRWWSKWARLRWHRKGYLLTSESLREPFFNRAGSLGCEQVGTIASWAERAFARQGTDATMLVFDSCAVASEKLLGLGYARVDTMSVLMSGAPIGAPKLEGWSVEPTTSPKSWTRAYLRAFYGSEDLSPVVAPIVARLLKSREVTLLECRVKGETAGVLALFRTHGIGGVYCVGTVPEFRRLGVATVLLAKAKQSVEGEGRRMVLQTLASEGSMDLYVKRGFKVMYSKHVLERKLKS
jgi:GNAT superfamily N-acetyltransferase